MNERKKCALVDKTNFVTFALDDAKLSIVHSKEKGKEMAKKVDKKTPRDLELADTTIYTREEGPTVQRCGDSEVVGKWINGWYSLGKKHQGQMNQIQDRNTIRKLITGQTWEPQDKDKLLLAKAVIQRHGWLSRASWMAVTRTEVKADVGR